MTDRPRDDRARQARDLFLTDSNNCAQSIIRVFANLNKEAEAAVIPLGWALGGGLVSQGYICGTILGAVMALGAKLRYERGLSSAATEAIIQEFIQEFQARNGSLQCRDIVGELEPEAFERVCRPMVYDTSLMIEESLARSDEENESDERR